MNGNYLGIDHTPLTFTISIGRGSDCITLWLWCLCRVLYKPIRFCAWLPIFPSFSLMCLVAQLDVDLSHGRILLQNTVEIFRWSAAYGLELITRDVWGELLASSYWNCYAPRLCIRGKYMYSGWRIIQIMLIQSLGASEQIHEEWDHLL